MIARAFFRLLPFMCLLMASAKAKHDDTPSRRLSSPRQLRGINDFDIEESISPPIVDNDWNDPEGVGDRLLKKKKKKKKGKKKNKGKKGKKKEGKEDNDKEIPDDDDQLNPALDDEVP